MNETLLSSVVAAPENERRPPIAGAGDIVHIPPNRPESSMIVSLVELRRWQCSWAAAEQEPLASWAVAEQEPLASARGYGRPE